MKQITVTNSITNRESESFKKYLKEISDIKVFETPEQEHECAMKAWNGDERAKKELITRNLRFVITCAKQYRAKGVSLEDLVNEGNIGIATAANRFNPTMGYKFISYAVWYIRRDIIVFLNTNSRLIKLPNNKVDAVAKFKNDISSLEQELQRTVETGDLLKLKDDNGDLKYTKDDIELLNELTFNDVSSLDMSVGEDGSAPLSDLISDSSLGGADELVVKSDMDININRIFSALKPKEKEILTMLFGLDGNSPRTLADVGDELGISREMVRQRKVKAFQRINGRFKSNIRNILSN